MKILFLILLLAIIYYMWYPIEPFVDVVLHDPFYRVIQGVPVPDQPYRLVDNKYASIEDCDTCNLQISKTPNNTVENILIDIPYMPRRIRPPHGKTGFPHPCDPSPIYTDRFNELGRYMAKLPENQKEMVYKILGMPDEFY